jgi:peptide/nickel transport system substrate-binding protein
VQAQFAKYARRSVFTRFCGVPTAKVAVCANVGWFKDYTDPQPMLKPTFDGDAILAQGNNNWPQLDVPVINQAMAAATPLPPGPARNRAWGRINHMIMAEAPAVPLVWNKSAMIASDDVNDATNGYLAQHDVSFTSLR